MLKCIIIDDEPLALDVLENYISRLPFVTLLKRCSNSFDALEFLHTNTVDVIFLDIEMPEMNGLNFVNVLKDPPHIVFTTAHREYALEGFDLDISDFLLKPVSFDRFVKAVNKVIEIAGRKRRESPKPVSTPGNQLFVRSGSKTVPINIPDILYVEGMKDYIKVYTGEGRVIVRDTMRSFEEKLPEGQFLRVHKSYIISVKYIDAVMRNKVEVAGRQIPIGRNYYEHVNAFIRKNQ